MSVHAVQITKFGGPKVLKVTDVEPQLLPSDGVRIRVKAAGVNFADVMMRMGMYPEAPKPPFTPGYEVAGEVIETGSEVRTLKTGDRVVAPIKFGGYTNEVVLPDWQVRKTPSNLTDAEAAGVPVAFMTAWVALCDMARVRKGDRVLIHSAAGGVGTAAVQIAADVGAEVVGLVGSEKKFDVVKGLGAHEAWTTERWMNSKPGELGSFDVILDAVGGRALKHGYKYLKPAGRVVNFGLSSAVGRRRSLLKLLGLVRNMPIYTPVGLMMGNKGVFGLNMLQLLNDPGIMTAALDAVLKGLGEKRYKVLVGKAFPLEKVGEAHDHLMSRGNLGKVVLTC